MTHGNPGAGGNRLRHASSAYLRQHADNPVDWFPWGEEAQARSRGLDRPIFLSIGYSSCHWCHVMEHEVFEDAEVAALLNASFVPIKVDREDRPDLDAIYMDAVQTLTGSGGWPLSVFLTPQLEPFYGGTYFPRDHFVMLLRRLSELYDQQRGLVTEQARRVVEVVAAPILPQPDGPALGAELLSSAAERAAAAFDPEWGGVRGRAKFPSPPRWSFLLHLHRKTGEERLGQMLRTTLEAMASGGIRDHIGGGFHRYTVEPTWLVPHFEKMLYDNALLAELYLEASAALAEPAWGAVAADTLDFLLTRLRDPQGGFCASLDADSPEGEGSYYVWRPEELSAIAGPTDGQLLAALLGVTAEGNHAGRNVLTRRLAPEELARRTQRNPAELAGLFDRWRPALRAQQEQRPAPALDRKVVTAWNGLTIAALAKGSLLLDDERYLAAARQAAEFLWRQHRSDDGGLLRSSYDGRAEHAGVLEDYSSLARGLLALFQAGAGDIWLQRALELVEQARTRFGHPGVGWAMVDAAGEAPLGRKSDLFDTVTPSGSSELLRVLLELAALTGREHYRAEAETTLQGAATLLRRSELEMAGWLDAVLHLHGPLHEVVVAGEPGDPRTRALLRAHSSLLPSFAVLARVPAAGATAGLAELVPATRGKSGLDGAPCAYVCQRGSCQLPTQDPLELRRQLLQGWTR